MTPFPTETARHLHMAGAYLFAADAFEASESGAQRSFAPTLRHWSDRASERARIADAGGQPDLFPHTKAHVHDQ